MSCSYNTSFTNNCNTCLWAMRDGYCGIWSCEYIGQNEAYDAWQETIWIPVEDELPKDGERVLVCCDIGEDDYYVNMEIYSSKLGWNDVVAWRPSPKPCKRRSNVKDMPRLEL